MPPPASMSDGSTDGQSEKCPTCTCEFVTQKVGNPEACNHSFCVDCLQEWLKNTDTSPTDRQVCDIILVRRCRGEGEEVVRGIHVEPPRQQEEDEVIDYFTHCEVCGDSNHFYALIQL
jgi:PHD and RING finger domain-containing protein 1